MTSLLLIFLYMTLWFFISLAIRRNDFVDVAWGGGFLLLSLFGILKQSPLNYFQWIFNLCIWAWALRLASFIFIRNLKKVEDFRYKAWRETWKYFYLRSYFQIYLLQGALLYLIALPIMGVNASPTTPVSFSFYLGLLIWILGFLIESIADAQMLAFKRQIENKGKIIQQGLWRYSRHPNYFGEVTLWWGVFIMACAFGFHFYYLVSPLLITYLILFLSGIPMLEKKYEGRPDFEAYKAKTSAFVPWFVKK